MLNWDDPLSTVQNKEKNQLKAQGEVNLKTSISDTNKSKIPSEKVIEPKFREDINQIDDNGMTGLEELVLSKKVSS